MMFEKKIFQMNVMRIAIGFALLVSTGCDFTLSGGGDVSTTTPTKEQIAKCRKVMYINPDVVIEPLGYALDAGMDDVIRFKFIAKMDDPSMLFDDTQVESTKFKPILKPSSFFTAAPETWWKLSSKATLGAKLSVPPPNSKGTRGLNIAYTKNDDKTLTVYVLWYET
ncbi:hypothetical protein N9B23_00355 [bacterium]|nr:hypothetical protein [bacterium]